MTHRRLLVRSVSILALALLGAATPATKQVNNASDGPPPASMLQSGDLLWPKVAGVWVPYSSQPGTETESAEKVWTQERDAYLKELLEKPKLTDQERQRYEELQTLDYPTFKKMYLNDLERKALTEYSGSVAYVGHVGIVDVIDGTPWVYEAVMGLGVRRISYADWLTSRKGELVWLGRLNKATAAQRSKVASTALQFIGQPYRFFNFDLSDTSGFYCSKLVWYCIKTATGVPPDDDDNPQRILWYSPKRLMRSPHITLLYNPGNYAIR